MASTPNSNYSDWEWDSCSKDTVILLKKWKHTHSNTHKIEKLQNNLLESSSLLRKQVIIYCMGLIRENVHFLFSISLKEKKISDELLNFQLGHSLFET